MSLSPEKLKEEELTDQILEDLECRFIINAPDEDYESTDRIMFHIEAARWFYVDIVVPAHNLSEMALKPFTQKIFRHCPPLREHKNVTQILASWGNYKRQVPVRGAIILNSHLDKVILVKGVGSNAWTFPGGKVNRDESDKHCALREVYEEINFDLSPFLSDDSYFEKTVYRKPYKFYVTCSIPEEYDFKPNTVGEIDLIQWFNVNDLPPFPAGSSSKYKERQFYIVDQFMFKLRLWIFSRKRMEKKESKVKKIVQSIEMDDKPEEDIISSSSTQDSPNSNTLEINRDNKDTINRSEVPLQERWLSVQPFSNFRFMQHDIMSCLDPL